MLFEGFYLVEKWQKNCFIFHEAKEMILFTKI